jgi:hypothetical protein
MESSRSETTEQQTENTWAWGTGKIDIVGQEKEKKKTTKESKGKRKGQSTVEERAELFLQALVEQGWAHFGEGETVKKPRREPEVVRVPVGALKRLKHSIPQHIRSSTPVFMWLLLSLPVDLVERSYTSVAASRELRAKFISPSCGELPADGDLAQKDRDLDFFVDSQAALLMEETRARLAASLEILAKSKGATVAHVYSLLLVFFSSPL